MVTVIETPFNAVLGKAHISGFSFEAILEVVLGPWILEIWYGQQKLVERRFLSCGLDCGWS